MATNGNPDTATTTNELGFAGFHQQFTTVQGLKLCSYTNIHPEKGLAAFEKKKTLLVLIHGYPQSPYMWRHVAPPLAAAGYALFIPDLPGYANSPNPTQSLRQDKLSVGTTILQSLKQHLGNIQQGNSAPQDLILITHDRGSRVGHRLAVSKPLSDVFRFKALCIMDIVPTTEQFAGLGRVPVAKGYFHWPMLANVDIATKLITSMGGGNWVRAMVDKMTNHQDTKDAVAVYAPQFDDEAVVRASCRDYEAAALVDVPAQKEDQEHGRKVDVPMLIFWSQAGIGNWFEVGSIWKKWMKEGVDAECCPVGEGASHYLAEDTPQIVIPKLLSWLQKVDR